MMVLEAGVPGCGASWAKMLDTYAHRAAARIRSMTWGCIDRKLIDLATAYLRFRSRRRERSMHEEQTSDQRGPVDGSL